MVGTTCNSVLLIVIRSSSALLCVDDSRSGVTLGGLASAKYSQMVQQRSLSSAVPPFAPSVTQELPGRRDLRLNLSFSNTLPKLFPFGRQVYTHSDTFRVGPAQNRLQLFPFQFDHLGSVTVNLQPLHPSLFPNLATCDAEASTCTNKGVLRVLSFVVAARGLYQQGDGLYTNRRWLWGLRVQRF